MILGLDISTSITGYTLLDDSGNVIKCDHIELAKYNNFYHKAEHTQFILANLFNTYDIKSVFIEESLQMFSMGKSSAKTLATLTKFNGVITWIIFDKFGITPEHIPAVTARKKCGIKTEKGRRGKECVMEYMKANESWFQIDYTKKGNIKPYCYDRADSFVIAKAGFLSQ